MKDDEWPILCSARPEFVSLSRDEVWRAIGNDSDGENRVTAEVMRLGAEFLATFKIYVDQHGFKARGMNFPVGCPIEQVAIETVVRFVQAHSGPVQAGKRH